MNLTNNSISDKLICNDTYRNISLCTMKCQAVSGNENGTLLATMAAEGFSQPSCILDLNMDNNSFQYILQIPIDNYLIYLTNSTVTDFNFSCVNNTVLMTPQMLCLYEFDGQPFSSPPCLSRNITSRYIRPGQSVFTSISLQSFHYRLC
jgi:hypothetical protein